MRLLTLLFALSVGAYTKEYDHDIRLDVYDTVPTFVAGASLKYFVNIIKKTNEVHLSKDIFSEYDTCNIHDVFVVYQNEGDLHGYYLKTGSINAKVQEHLHPLDEYIHSGDYYVLTPLAVLEVAPKLFNTPLQHVHYEYYSDVQLDKKVPVVFIVPKSEITPATTDTLINIAQYEITKNGIHHIIYTFDNETENAARPVRDLAKTEYYGETKEFVTNVDSPVVHRSPVGFRLVTSGQHDLPVSPVDLYGSYDHLIPETVPIVGKLQSRDLGHEEYGTPIFTEPLSYLTDLNLRWQHVIPSTYDTRIIRR